MISIFIEDKALKTLDKEKEHFMTITTMKFIQETGITISSMETEEESTLNHN